MIVKEETFDDGDGFDDEFTEDVNEIDTNNIFEELMNEARNHCILDLPNFSC